MNDDFVTCLCHRCAQVREEVIREMSREFSTVLEMIRELRREALRLRDTQHDSELLCSQQENAACRKRIQELESERAAGLQISITPSPLRSTLTTSTSIYAQPMVLPAVDPSVNANSDQLTPTVDNLLP